MSITLTSDELKYIRDSVGELMPDVGYILTVTNTADGAGGVTESLATSSAYMCRIDPDVNRILKSGESMAGGGISPFHRFILTLPYDTTINTDNRFKCGTETYNIISVDRDKSWRASVRAYIERR